MLWLFAALTLLISLAFLVTVVAVKFMLALWFLSLVMLPLWLGNMAAALIHPLAGIIVGAATFWCAWQFNRWLLQDGARRQDP